MFWRDVVVEMRLEDEARDEVRGDETEDEVRDDDEVRGDVVEV